VEFLAVNGVEAKRFSGVFVTLVINSGIVSCGQIKQFRTSSGFHSCSRGTKLEFRLTYSLELIYFHSLSRLRWFGILPKSFPPAIQIHVSISFILRKESVEEDFCLQILESLGSEFVEKHQMFSKQVESKGF
jgi:hypothetical protein